MYSIKITELAAQMLRSIESNARTQILAKIERLRDEPKLQGKALLGPLREFRAVRAAGQRYRIVFQIRDELVLVVVVAVGIRKTGDKKDIYELMKRFVRTGILKGDG